jgi:hypothetical protein
MVRDCAQNQGVRGDSDGSLGVEVPSTRLGLKLTNTGEKQNRSLVISGRDKGKHRSKLLALKVIDADFSTAELNIVRSIYLRTSKPPDTSLVETCFHSMFTGLTTSGS